MTHPPPPGGFVQPNVTPIEDALRRITFPISKRELIEQLDEEDTVTIDGKNVDLITVVRELHDDNFESEAEFRDELEAKFALEASDQPAERDAGP